MMEEGGIFSIVAYLNLLERIRDGVGVRPHLPYPRSSNLLVESKVRR